MLQRLFSADSPRVFRAIIDGKLRLVERTRYHIIVVYMWFMMDPTNIDIARNRIVTVGRPSRINNPYNDVTCRRVPPSLPGRGPDGRHEQPPPKAFLHGPFGARDFHANTSDSRFSLEISAHKFSSRRNKSSRHLWRYVRVWTSGRMGSATGQKNGGYYYYYFIIYCFEILNVFSPTCKWSAPSGFVVHLSRKLLNWLIIHVDR